MIIQDEWPSRVLSGIGYLAPALIAIGVTQRPGGIAADLGEAIRRLVSRTWIARRVSAGEPAAATPPSTEAGLASLGITTPFTEADIDAIDGVLATPEGYRGGSAG
jgi:hypothetical protein